MIWSARLLSLVLVLAAFVALLPEKGGSPAEGAPTGLVSVVDGQLVGADGKPLFMFGTNYEGFPDRSWRMWEDGLFDPGLIDRDMAKAKRAGVKVLRIFIQKPLPAEIAAGKWAKLDTVVNLARKHDLLLLITLFDYSEPELSKVAETGRLIAQRYANEPAILGYGLKNEPHYQDIAASKYPAGVTVPLMTDALIKHYGQRVTEQAVAAWRLTNEGKSLVPARFTAREAYLYTNNYRIYREFLDAAGKWVVQRNYDRSTLDYIDSPDAAPWARLLGAMDDSLRSWIAVQMDAVRSVDKAHLITVGYSDMILAKLSANKALDFQAVHRYPGGSPRDLGLFFDVLRNIKSTFPGKPVVLEEFGYSNAGLSSAASSIYETAFFLHLWKEGYAGGLKWMLNDLASGWDARQMNFGMYTPDEKPKPVVAAMNALASYFDGALAPGDLRREADAATGIRYTYSASNALFVAGKSFADGRLRYQSDGPAQVFLNWRSPTAVSIQSTAHAAIQIKPSALVGDAGLEAAGGFSLDRLEGDARVAHQIDVNGGWVAFNAEAGREYVLKLPARSVEARIQIVWPIGDRPVSQATKANIGVYLFEPGSARSICADGNLRVELWRGLNNEVEELVGPGLMAVKSTSAGAVPSWEFNDVDVGAARDPVNKYYFRVAVPGSAAGSGNVWSHGEDARTYFPKQDVPAGVKASPPAEVDAKIEIVWPHGNLPVSQATRANVGVMIFERGTLQSVPTGWNPIVKLWRSVNNEAAQVVATGRVETRTVDGKTFPMWSFDNVDVSPATDPKNKLYFRVSVDGVPSRGNIWSHGVDARTYFPRQEVPTPGGC